MMTLALLAGLYMFITAGRFGPALKLLIFFRQKRVSSAWQEGAATFPHVGS